jgi:tetratricopeptide (TPR) repeat protein
MRTLLPACLVFALAVDASAQFPGLTLPASGKNQKASTIQYIGPVKVAIHYSSPAVHGPDGKDRRGQIWGKLVPYGLSNQGFGNGKPTPWRAGANENTIFEVSNDVMIEGQKLPAGRYGLHMIADPEQWTVIFNRNADAWGSFWYEESEDVLRVKVKPHKHEYREYLTYEFSDRKPDHAVAELQWEELAVPWQVKVENLNDIYISRIGHDLTNQAGFSWQGYDAAAQATLTLGDHYEKGLEWANSAISLPFIGESNFQTLRTKAQILGKLGRDAEAKTVMQTAIKNPATTPLQIHVYGRQLLTEGKKDEAMEVFKLNAQRNGDAWPVHVGLARAYSAKGDYPQALEHAKKALEQAPDDLNRKSLQGMVESLSAGKAVEN